MVEDRGVVVSELDETTAQLKLRERQLSVLKAEVETSVRQTEMELRSRFLYQLEKKDEAIRELKKVVSALLAHAESLHQEQSASKNFVEAADAIECPSRPAKVASSQEGGLCARI